MVFSRLAYITLAILFYGCHFAKNMPIYENSKMETYYDSLEIELYNAFPKGFLSELPTIISSNDTLFLDYNQKWQDQHLFFVESVVSRTFFLFDSLEFPLVSSKLKYVNIRIYSATGQHKSEPVHVALAMEQEELLSNWDFFSYKNLNSKILTEIDPINYWKYDEIITLYWKETNSNDFATNFTKIYDDLLLTKHLSKSNRLVLDSLVVRAQRNSDKIDVRTIEYFREKFYALELESHGELKIIDQEDESSLKKD